MRSEPCQPPNHRLAIIQKRRSVLRNRSCAVPALQHQRLLPQAELLRDQQHPRPERRRNRPDQKANHPPLRPIPVVAEGPGLRLSTAKPLAGHSAPHNLNSMAGASVTVRLEPAIWAGQFVPLRSEPGTKKVRNLRVGREHHAIGRRRRARRERVAVNGATSPSRRPQPFRRLDRTRSPSTR